MVRKNWKELFLFKNI